MFNNDFFGRPWLAPVDPVTLARREHAFLCRCEGETYKQIGKRLGVGPNRAMHLTNDFSRIMSWAIRRASYEIKTD
jgi:hypothetical protein